MRARMTDRDAYRRAKDIDGKLIAEQAAAATRLGGAYGRDRPTQRDAIALYDRFTHEGLDAPRVHDADGALAGAPRRRRSC